MSDSAFQRIEPQSHTSFADETSLVSQQTQTEKQPASAGFITGYFISNVISWFAVFPVIQYLLPAQAVAIDKTHALSAVALLLSLGTLVDVPINPLMGAISDRTYGRFGRRRPWIVIGVLGSVLCLALMANAPSLLVLGVGWVVSRACYAAVLQSLPAIIPDRIPEKQLGQVSALFGLATNVGILIGAIVIGRLIVNIQLGYYVLIAVALLGLGSFALLLRDPPITREEVPPFHLRQFLSSFWINPRKHPDFGWAWITRFLVMFGYSIGTSSFQYFFLQDVIHYQLLFPGHSVKEAVAMLVMISSLVLIPVALFMGFLSDRLQRRKPFVIAASMLIALALALLALFPSWPMAIVSTIVIGIGGGSYFGIDMALIVSVLPSQKDRAKDLAIITIANVLSQSIAPIMGSFIVTNLAGGNANGYIALYLVAAVFVLLGAFFVLPIKSVR